MLVFPENVLIIILSLCNKENTMKYDFLVVGSGLYGAIFAHEAKAKGKSVLVVDKRPNIAGNVYTSMPSSRFSTILVYPPIGIP